MLVVTIVGVLVAVVGVYLAYLTYRQGEGPAATVTPVASSPSITPPDTGAMPSSLASTSNASAGTAPKSVCGLPGTGAPVDCRDPRAALQVVGTACDRRSILTTWTLDPELDALDLALTERTGSCWVSPAEAARRAGATSADLVTATRGEVTAVLRECARGKDLLPTACSAAHDVEWVGGWATIDDSVRLETLCRDKVVAYARMTVSGMENRLIAESAERTSSGRRQARCLVRVEGITLNGSVRSLRNGPLPMAPG